MSGGDRSIWDAVRLPAGVPGERQGAVERVEASRVRSVANIGATFLSPFFGTYSEYIFYCVNNHLIAWQSSILHSFQHLHPFKNTNFHSYVQLFELLPL